jgi:hypothetical protein
MTSVQKHSPRNSVSSPEAATRALLDTVSLYTNRLEDAYGETSLGGFGRKIISAGLAPRDADRAVMEDRRSHLLACLEPARSPADQTLLARVVGGLLAAFPTFGASEEQAKLAVGMICRALDDVPVWAVQRAAANFLKGPPKVQWSNDRAPTPPQIRAEAKWIILDVETELHRLSQVLDAELVDSDTTQDERDAAIAHWAQIRAGIASSNVVGDRTEDEVNRERDAQQRANRLVRAKEGKVQSSLSAQLKAGREPFETERKGEAA